MTESQKALAGFAIIVCGFIAFFAWVADFVYPALTWSARIVAPGLAIAAGVMLVLDRFSKNEVPDFIWQHGIHPFERDGFSFVFTPCVENGVMIMRLYFQNSYQRPCSARVECRPALGFWLQTHNITPMAMDIECPGGGYGRTDFPMAIPKQYQGQAMTFEVGVRHRYRLGRGRRLLYRTGLPVGKPRFTTRGRALFSVLGALAGSSPEKPATFSVTLPQGVAEHYDAPLQPGITLLWKLGDPVRTKACAT